MKEQTLDAFNVLKTEIGDYVVLLGDLQGVGFFFYSQL